MHTIKSALFISEWYLSFVSHSWKYQWYHNNPWRYLIFTAKEQISSLHLIGFYSAFTVWYPVNGPTAGTVSFSRIVTNIGGQYFPNTGKFYCSHPGIYYFSMAIYKNYYSQVAYCYMRKNGAGLLYAQSTASSSSDGSHSAIVHLSSGDVVDLGGCSGVSYMSIYSSFSGFLLKAD